MTVADSAELASMAATVRGILTRLSPPSRVAAIADGPEGYDAQLWHALADDLGVTGVLVPEEFGGLGLGWREAGVVLAELGRSLACVPFLASCVVAPAVLAGSTAPAAKELLTGIADGSVIVAVALGDDCLYAAEPAAAVTATQHEDDAEWYLTGELAFVPDVGAAHRLLVPASTPAGEYGWFVVATDGAGVETVALPVIDATRPQGTVRLDAARALPTGAVPTRTGTSSSLRAVIADAVDAATTALACEQTAASQYLLELTVAYCKTRFQFGQPIGSFQAIQHRLADLAVAIDTAVSAVEYAVGAAADQPETWQEAASIAGFVCTETLSTAAAETIQLHGGVGFTWEHVAHRYYRRALASRPQFGAPAWHRERLLQALSI